jgi:hypothetical protein
MGSVRGGGGRVVSILSKEEAEKMQDMARELKFDFVDVEPLSDSFSRDTDGVFDVDKENVEELRQRLEDTLTLLNLAHDLNVDLDKPENDNYDDGDDEVDDDDDDDDGGDEDSFQ